MLAWTRRLVRSFPALRVLDFQQRSLDTYSSARGQGQSRRLENQPESGTVPCIQQALDKCLKPGPAQEGSGLASAEEYPEEYVDSSSASLGEEADSQFRGVPLGHSCKRQGAEHARGSAGLRKQEHTTQLQPRICLEYERFLHGLQKGRSLTRTVQYELPQTRLVPQIQEQHESRVL